MTAVRESLDASTGHGLATCSLGAVGTDIGDVARQVDDLPVTAGAPRLGVIGLSFGGYRVQTLVSC